MGQRSDAAGMSPRSSTGSPSTFRMRPRAAAPTGTVMKLPVSTISMPRTTPSVGSMDTARTWLRPMCCCTSSRHLQRRTALGRGLVDDERVVDLGELALELGVDDRVR